MVRSDPFIPPLHILAGGMASPLERHERTGRLPVLPQPRSGGHGVFVVAPSHVLQKLAGLLLRCLDTAADAAACSSKVLSHSNVIADRDSGDDSQNQALARAKPVSDAARPCREPVGRRAGSGPTSTSCDDTDHKDVA